MTTDHMEVRLAANAPDGLEIAISKRHVVALLAAYDALVSAKPKRKAKEKAAPTLVVLPDWIPQDAWDAFLSMRAEVKKSPTERAQKLLIDKLAELMRNGHSPGAVLDQSTFHGWLDVYGIKDGNGVARGFDSRNGRPVRVVAPEPESDRDARRARWGIPADSVEDISNG